MKTLNICCLITFVFGWSLNISYAQLNVVSGSTALQYAQELIGTGVSISNATLTVKDSHQIGMFSNGASTNLGLDEGIVLSTGNVEDTPNSASNQLNTEYTANCGIPGFFFIPCVPTISPDMSDIVGESVNDAAILEFDFIPAGSSISFQFVFGSDEYPSYVGQINDAFGILLSGPGINGPFQNNGINIATIPNSTDPISINSINDGNSSNCVNPGTGCTNCEFYVNNCGGTSIAFNGFTTVITSTYNVECGETYHIRFGVADALDASFDTGVFIKGKSLESGIEINNNAVTICQGDDVELTASLIDGGVGGSFSWEPNGETTSTITVNPSSTTDYIVHYIDGVCDITDTATVTVNQCGCFPPNLTLNNLAICDGDNTDLNDAIAPSSDAATLSFYNSQTNASTSNSPIGSTVNTNGSYWVRAEDPNDPTCFEVYEIEVTVTTITYSANKHDPSCGINDGEIILTPNGGNTPYNYSIDNGTTTQTGNTFSNLGAGGFNILITDGNGCEVTGTESLNNISGPSISNITSTDASCDKSNGTITVSTSGGTGTIYYTLDNGQTSNNGVFTGIGSGNYSVTIKDDNGCETNENISVGTIGGPTLAIIDVEDVSCFNGNDGSAEINSTGGTLPYTFDWSPVGGSTEKATGLSAGNYTVKVTDNGGCIDQVQVTISEPDEIVIDATITNSFCALDNGEISLVVTGGTGGYSYTWSPNVSSSNEAENLAIGNYEVTVKDDIGCIVSRSYEIIQGNSFYIEAIPEIATVKHGESIDLNLFVDPSITVTNIMWSPEESLSCSDCKNPIATPEESTTYIVTVTDDLNCTSKDTVVVNVVFPCAEIYVPNTFSPNEDGFNDLQCVLGECIVTLDFTIFNRWGETVFQTKDQTECWDGTFRGELVQSGAYVYKLKATLENGGQVEESGSLTVVR